MYPASVILIDSSTVSLFIDDFRVTLSGMQDVIGTLGGFRGVRAEVLVALKKEQPLTASELASRFGLTANGLRRHLKVLEEDGVVRYQREVRGVGAPVFAYRLTEAGEAVFPRRYGSVLASALEALKAERGSQSVARVLAREWETLAADAGPVLEGLPLGERVQLVAELLTARGYMAEGHATGAGSATLRIHNCAMCEIAKRFPEACAVEARQLSLLLGAPVVRREHRIDGGELCAYDVGASAVDGLESSPCRNRGNDLEDETENESDIPSAVGASAPPVNGINAWEEGQA